MGDGTGSAPEFLAAVALVRGYLEPGRSAASNQQLASELLGEVDGGGDPMVMVNAMAELAANILRALSLFSREVGDEEMSPEELLDSIEMGLRSRRP